MVSTYCVSLGWLSASVSVCVPVLGVFVCILCMYVLYGCVCVCCVVMWYMCVFVFVWYICICCVVGDACDVCLCVCMFYVCVGVVYCVCIVCVVCVCCPAPLINKLQRVISQADGLPSHPFLSLSCLCLPLFSSDHRGLPIIPVPNWLVG